MRGGQRRGLTLISRFAANSPLPAWYVPHHNFSSMMVVCSTTTSGPFFNNHISESSSVPLLFHKSLAFSSVSCWLLLHSITPFLRHSLVMYRTVVNTRQLQYLCYVPDEYKVLLIKLEAAFYVWSIRIDFEVFGRNVRIYLCAKSSPISNFHLWSSSKWIWFWHTPTLPYPTPLKNEREEGPCCLQSRAQRVFWNRLHSSQSQCWSSSQKANRQAREEIAQTHHVKNIEAEVEISEYCDGAAAIRGPLPSMLSIYWKYIEGQTLLYPFE